MKTASAALKAHFGQEVTTLAILWKITRADSQVFGYTDHDVDITFSGVTYLAGTGHTPSSIKTTSQLNVDNLEVQSVLDTDITEADIEAGIWNYAAVLIQVVNYNDLTMGSMIMRQGWLGEIKTGRHNLVTELRGMMQPLQQVVGRIYTAGCDADLGDARCGVVLGGSPSAFTVSGAATSVASARQFTDTSRAEANGYFDGGLITWTGGNNATYRMEIKTFLAGVVTLQQAMPNAIVVGDAYTMTAGCDKLRATCVAKFNNVINFRGFADLPGQDAMISGQA
jgi:uncharacterized phage protein (TIGR02218 family)